MSVFFEKRIIDFDKLVMLMERTQSMDRTDDNFDELCWIAPPFGALKLNIDATWRSGDAALAILARDERAEPRRLWFSRTFLNAEWAEATKELLCACQIGVTLRAQHVILDSDCMVVINVVFD